MLMQNKSGFVFKVIRTFVTTSQVYRSHYDVLGITPKATQIEIKSAYYKLSKLYHPDKSSDEESAKKFRSITEAYEVLGNVQLKKMYDKGLIVGSENTSRVEYHPEPEPTDPTLRFYKSHAVRHVPPTMDGKTPIYDFDAWSRSHYGSLFETNKLNKERLHKKKVRNIQDDHSSQQNVALFTIAFISILFICLVTYGKTEYDEVKTASEKEVTNDTNMRNR